MRNYCLILALVCLHANLSAQKKSSSGSVLIRGKITQTASYCGGARPTEEVLDALKTPKPLANKVIYIKRGTENSESLPVITQVTTDENGAFVVRLKVGTTYSFLEDWKGQPFKLPKDTEFTKWDPTCFKERYNKADYVIKVKRSRNPVAQINFHNPCFYKPYCGTYTGPLPP